MYLPGWYVRKGELFILRRDQTAQELTITIDGKNFVFAKAEDRYDYYKYVGKKYGILYVLHAIGCKGVTKKAIKNDEAYWECFHPWENEIGGRDA